MSQAAFKKKVHDLVRKLVANSEYDDGVHPLSSGSAMHARGMSAGRRRTHHTKSKSRRGRASYGASMSAGSRKRKTHHSRKSRGSGMSAGRRKTHTRKSRHTKGRGMSGGRTHHTRRTHTRHTRHTRKGKGMHAGMLIGGRSRRSRHVTFRKKKGKAMTAGNRSAGSRKKKRGGAKKTSPWISFVKAFAKKNNMSYGDALHEAKHYY